MSEFKVKVGQWWRFCNGRPEKIVSVDKKYAGFDYNHGNSMALNAQGLPKYDAWAYYGDGPKPTEKLVPIPLGIEGGWRNVKGAPGDLANNSGTMDAEPVEMPEAAEKALRVGNVVILLQQGSRRRQ